MRGITKRFAHVIANDGVDFTLEPGEVHALLGENGAGKTTLMRILYGLTALDEGRIRVGGRAVAIGSPKDAIAAGVGMVTQHFSLVGPMSVADNIVLGNTGGWRVPPAAARARASDAAERFGIRVDPDAIVDRLSIGERQRVEILKALSRDCRVLVLDEPTAVLAPQEVEALFATIARLAGEGLSVVFISHKLAEVMAITDRVTVMRQGRVVGTVPRAETDERELARMMVGRVTSGGLAAGGRSGPGDVLLRVEGLRAQDDDGLRALDGVSLEVRAGEIVGIAGVSGNGQSELSEVLSGMRAPTAGSVEVAGRRLAGESPSAFIAAGVGRIPEDRHASVIAELSVAYNMALEDLGSFVSRGLLDEGRIRAHAERLIERFDIKARPGDRIRTLSGGNMQKVLLARVLARAPRVLVVSQPTRGLDVGATEYVRQQLLAQRAAGAAVLLVSEDLDEIFEMADRILVMYEGKVTGEADADVDELERVGLWMAGRSA
jgi:simple sugar transport system ATP-binding protein